MVISKNPFYFRELSPDDPFCDREKELADLCSFAQGRANLVLFSPRRYGKTSLIRRVQRTLGEQGAVPIFVDFFGVVSVEDVAARLARAVFEVTRPKEHLFKTAIQYIKSFRPVLKPDMTGGVSLTVEASADRRSGLDVLDDTMSSLGSFIESYSDLVNIAMDEFQEIVQLKEARQIEGVMRSHIQTYTASCSFIGSRRRVLLAMFNEQQRPFFQSAINYELKLLPREALTTFIEDMFKRGGKGCNRGIAESITTRISMHPYYAQKLSFFIYEIAQREVAEDDVVEAMRELMESERPFFESILQGLAPQQIALLKAIAHEPSESLFSFEYMKRNGLGSTGGMQGALKKLTSLDLVEQHDGKRWNVVDPLFAQWLAQR